MKKIIVASLLLFNICFAQQTIPTPGKERISGIAKRKSLEENSLVKGVEFRSVGPTVMGGRVVDIDVCPSDPTKFYVAYASGGLWKTINNGLSFTPVFDKEDALTIGDIAVDWNNGEIIWVGTGENNSSRSSYSGVGIYKSTDTAKTWTYMGLEESHHIGRIVLHPKNANTAWIAVLGHLYTANKERGVYKTIDGGKTWKQTLFKDINTGAIDLIVDPSNPEILYAALWNRDRKAWNFIEAGSTSGIYKSIDGGETWSLASTAQSGFPANEGVGRIGLTIYPKNPNILYAIVDNQNRRTKEDKKEENKLDKDKLRKISKEDFLKLDDKDLSAFLNENDFPKKHTAKEIKEKVKNGKLLPIALVEYVEDANSLLFDTPVIGAEIYRSDDAGKTWKKTHEKYLEDLFYSYGYYFGQIHVSPTNPDKIYTVGVPIIKSTDGGKTFTSIDADNMHGDYHSIWSNPNKEGHLIIGNDGGLNISYDDGKAWFKANTPAVGQFYAISYDMEKPYNIYGGLQDNGVWFGSSAYKASTGWQQEGSYPYKFILGGDGMQVAVDPRDNKTVYSGYQFGNYFRIDKVTGETKKIQPIHELGERPLRFNWQTPIWLSIHNPDILYLGSNKFHRSMNKGDEFKTLSGDLTQGGKKGDVAFGTLTSIHESPLKFGLIYVGSDDGLIHISKDGGYTWTKISDKLPQNLWVSRVWASAHNEATVYVSLNGYRNDNFTSYIYKSDNYGSTWEKIGIDLPAEPVNVIKEDPANSNIIYVGTDNGIYVSINKGKSFMGMNNSLPRVAVHDLFIHPRDNELVIGTHGRSVYVANVKELQLLKDSIISKDIYAFTIESIKHNQRWGESSSKWDKTNEPKVQLPVFIGSDEKINVTVQTEKGLTLKSFETNGSKGLNYINYDLTFDKDIESKYSEELNAEKKNEDDKIKIKAAGNEKYYLLPGKYKINFSTEKGQNKSLTIEITGGKN